MGYSSSTLRAPIGVVIMNHMAFFVWLSSINPLAPALVGNALAVLAVFTTVYLLRRFAPGLWLALTKWIPDASTIDVGAFFAFLIKLLQSLPGQVLGIALAALTSGGKQQFIGALWGILAAALHEILAWAPLPYKGAVGGKKDGGDGPSGGAPVVHITIPPSPPPPAA